MSKKQTIKKDLPKVSDNDINALAQSIKQEREEERIQEEEVLEEIEQKAPSFEEIAQPIEQPVTKAEPVIITEGQTPLNPIKIKRTEREVFKFLSDTFGNTNKSFFVLNELTQWKTIRGIRKRLQVMLIEDSNGFRYQLWFDISALSLLG